MKNRNELNLYAMELVEAYSKSLKTISWIWGGFTIDIYENRILREHDDLDYLTLNLHSLIPRFSELFASCGWKVNVLENGDLRLQREDVKIHLGHVELSDKARWTHNGEKGSIWFPSNWLNLEPVNFCGVEIHVIKPEFQYVMIERPKMLNPNWKHRDKDISARKYLRSLIEGKGITPQTLFEQVCDTDFQSS
jgi:hypothetical protein